MPQQGDRVNVNVSHYTAMDLTEAEHIHDPGDVAKG